MLSSRERDGKLEEPTKNPSVRKRRSGMAVITNRIEAGDVPALEIVTLCV